MRGSPDALSAPHIETGQDMDIDLPPLTDLKEVVDASDQKLASFKVNAEKTASDLSQARRQLGERDEIISNLRKEQTLASQRITALEGALQHSLEMRELPSEIAESLQTVSDAIHAGDDPASAFLAAVDYDRNAVDDALLSVVVLKKANADLARTVAPLTTTLKAGGVKAWLVRWALAGQ
jgi:hypothetical protein